jgi:hypothetical protein
LSCNITVKANKTRARHQQQSIEDFSEAEWDKIISIILAQEAEFNSNTIVVSIEVAAQGTKDMARHTKYTNYSILSYNPINTPSPLKK